MELVLEAVERSETGKDAAKRARAAGEVPAILYGHGTEPMPIAVRSDALYTIIRGEAGVNALINLKIGKEEGQLVMIKELQRHPLKEALVHADFLRVARDEKIIVRVPITIQGESASQGIKDGGTLQQLLWDVEVECLPTDIPDQLFVDISEFAIGDLFVVEQLDVPEGIRVLEADADAVLTILAPRQEEEEEEEIAEEGEEVEEESAAEANAEEE